MCFWNMTSIGLKHSGIQHWSDTDPSSAPCLDWTQDFAMKVVYRSIFITFKDSLFCANPPFSILLHRSTMRTASSPSSNCRAPDDACVTANEWRKRMDDEIGRCACISSVFNKRTFEREDFPSSSRTSYRHHVGEQQRACVKRLKRVKC